MDLAICLLFFERLDQTIECVQSLLPSKAKIYILNNGSSPSARKGLGKFCRDCKQVKIFDSGANLGVGVGRNYLVKKTGEEWLLFLDNDIVIETRDWLRRFSQHVSLNKEAEVFVPRIFDSYSGCYKPVQSVRISGKEIKFRKKILPGMTNVFPGGASFISRRLFDRLGLFDEKMFVGFEDYEFCVRGVVAGNAVKSLPISDIKLVHSHHYAKKSGDRTAALTRYNIGLLEASLNQIAEKHGLVFKSKKWKPLQLQQADLILNKKASKAKWTQRTAGFVTRILWGEW